MIDKYLKTDSAEEEQQMTDSMNEGISTPRYVLVEKTVYAIAKVDSCLSNEEAVQYVKTQIESNPHHTVNYLKASGWKYYITGEKAYAEYLSKLNKEE